MGEFSGGLPALPKLKHHTCLHMRCLHMRFLSMSISKNSHTCLHMRLLSMSMFNHSISISMNHHTCLHMRLLSMSMFNHSISMLNLMCNMWQYSLIMYHNMTKDIFSQLLHTQWPQQLKAPALQNSAALGKLSSKVLEQLSFLAMGSLHLAARVLLNSNLVMTM